MCHAQYDIIYFSYYSRMQQTCPLAICQELKSPEITEMTDPVVVCQVAGSLMVNKLTCLVTICQIMRSPIVTGFTLPVVIWQEARSPIVTVLTCPGNICQEVRSPMVTERSCYYQAVKLPRLWNNDISFIFNFDHILTYLILCSSVYEDVHLYILTAISSYLFPPWKIYRIKRNYYIGK